ncbi:ABC transporter ATP-binding protein [Aequorivita viscosa]|uniref:Peptide/nickel transport system ATP-binding protein n=1 Tax=Aequorivita viscosa TaxID=797419 RepID=A0A1M6DPC2_9FLAO|nr:ABC transporter ATP-binding protein [Aequorivita viscosa]SDW50429.1 peptide/nickel transport system ATP-binding protein [Aequorivita viscosa]SHI75104.1 peptide/nickel transport system ATP-binding protein [Aequorivita viscosa]
MTKSPLLSVQELVVSFGKKGKATEVLHTISFDVHENEILGIVGESGSGKSVTSLSIMGLLPKKTAHTSGRILFENKDLLKTDEKEFRAIRGKEIAMIFQEPMSALNPSLKCGKQVSEILKLHLKLNSSEAKKETISLFEKVKLPRPNEIYNSYPHQISGGQMQRVMIAMAIACKPKLLIADEPTTALDVTVQKEIMSLLKSIQQETKMAMLFISHDLNLVSEIADRVMVMYKGDVVENATTFEIFKTPKAEYTKALLEARPALDVRLATLPTIASIADKSFVAKEIKPTERAKKHKQIYTQTPILEISNLKKYYYSSMGIFSKSESVKAVDDISFSVFEGETLGLVGESGCGKSTLGKTILQLEKATSGSIKYKGRELTKLTKTEIRNLRKEIQIIFQDPYSSLNPRLPIGEALMEPMEVHQLGKSRKDRKEKALLLLKRVGLDDSYFNRYPHELSGGQRQRVGIARTIAVEPKLVICDESVSALDISVQAQVLNVLNELKNDFGFTYIFISHDLAVVKYMSDQLLVMNKGKIEELGDADEIYANPQTEYTKKLVGAIPKGI